MYTDSPLYFLCCLHRPVFRSRFTSKKLVDFRYVCAVILRAYLGNFVNCFLTQSDCLLEERFITIWPLWYKPCWKCYLFYFMLDI